jgi:hypothetical protein
LVSSEHFKQQSKRVSDHQQTCALPALDVNEIQAKNKMTIVPHLPFTPDSVTAFFFQNSRWCETLWCQKMTLDDVQCDAEKIKCHLSHWPRICKVTGGHLNFY